MTSNGLIPNIRSYNIVLAGLFANGEVEKALSRFEHMQKTRNDLDIITYTIMIHGMCKACMVKEAYDLFYKLKFKRVEPDFKAYTIMIAELNRAGMRTEADALNRFYQKHVRQNESAPAEVS